VALLGADLLLALAGRGSQLLVSGRVGLQFARLQFAARPNRGGTGEDRAGVYAGARAAIGLRLGLGEDLELRLEAGPGISLRSLSAVDAGAEVTGAGGLNAHAELGFGVNF